MLTTSEFRQEATAGRINAPGRSPAGCWRRYAATACRPAPWTAVFHCSQGGGTVREAAIGDDVERLALQGFLEVAEIAAALLANERLGIGFGAGTEDLQGEVTTRLVAIPLTSRTATAGRLGGRSRAGFAAAVVAGLLAAGLAGAGAGLLAGALATGAAGAGVCAGVRVAAGVVGSVGAGGTGCIGVTPLLASGVTGGAELETVGGTAADGRPPSSSPPCPAAWASGSRMTGCDSPTNGSGNGWLEPLNSTAGPLPGCWAWAGVPPFMDNSVEAVCGASGLLLPCMNQAAITPIATTARITRCFLGKLKDPPVALRAAPRLASIASIRASRATWLIAPGQPSDCSWMSTSRSLEISSMPCPAPSRRWAR